MHDATRVLATTRAWLLRPSSPMHGPSVRAGPDPHPPVKPGVGAEPGKGSPPIFLKPKK